MNAIDPGTLTAQFFASDEGQTYWVRTEWVTPRVLSSSTGGLFSIQEQITIPGARPPLHVHEFDEMHYVIEGEYEYFEGDKPPRCGGPGTIFHAPKGVVHTYKNVAAINSRLLALFAPGGFEMFFVEVGVPVDDKQARPESPYLGIEAVAALLKQYRTVFREPVTERDLY